MTGNRRPVLRGSYRPRRPAAIRSARRRGFAVLPGLVHDEKVEILTREARRLERDLVPLLAAQDGIRLNSIAAESPCIHHPHKSSPLILQEASNPAFLRILEAIIGPAVKMVQSQLFFKHPGGRGNAWHQDEAAIPTRDRSLWCIWIALERATTSNGCMRVVPATHSDGYMYPEVPHNEPDRYDFDTMSAGFDDSKALNIEMECGDVLVFNGYLIHGSEPNVSATSRLSLSYHYMNSYSLLPWKVRAATGEVVRPGRADYRDIVNVLGADPYAASGYEDLSRLHLRASNRDVER